MVENENIGVVESFLRENFSNYRIIEKSSHGPYWHVKVQFQDDVLVVIEGDIGFYILVRIGSEENRLWKFDRRVNEHGKTTMANIVFQLNILKEFLS